MNPNIDESVEAAGVFRALSDPFRLHIFTGISAQSAAAGEGDDAPTLSMPEVVEEIARTMNMVPDLVEQHIFELSRARLVMVGEDADGRLTLQVNGELMRRVRKLTCRPEDTGSQD
jgi:hypothetical protein